MERCVRFCKRQPWGNQSKPDVPAFMKESVANAHKISRIAACAQRLWRVTTFVALDKIIPVYNIDNTYNRTGNIMHDNDMHARK